MIFNVVKYWKIL